MAAFEDDLAACSALVIDGNPTSRSILVSQLRDFGVASVAQAARTVDARRQLEFRVFDFVLCEHSFSSDTESGQALHETGDRGAGDQRERQLDRPGADLRELPARREAGRRGDDLVAARRDHRELDGAVAAGLRGHRDLDLLVLCFPFGHF